MANNQEPGTQKRKIKIWPIVAMLAIVLFVVLMLIPTFQNIGITQYTQDAFIYQLNSATSNADQPTLVDSRYNSKHTTYVTSVTVSPYGGVLHILEGEMYQFENAADKGKKITFKVTLENETYSEQLRFYQINFGDNSGKVFDLTAEKVSLSQRIQDEIDYSKQLGSGWWANKGVSTEKFGFVPSSSAYETTILDTILNMLPYLLLGGISIALIWFMLSRVMGQAGKSNDQAMSFNNSRARRVTKSKVRFDDVAGCDEEKAELVEVVDYLKNPKRFTDFGAKLPKGILLVGPPGTGKTLLAKAVAGEAGVPFFSISGSDFVEMFVGVGAGRVRDMFKKAKQSAPCIVFIDEIDAVGRQRGAGLGGGNDEREQTLNQLLVEMDGFSDNSGIIIIAATNREDVLDPALLRAGRFDRQITVNLPDRLGREAIFHVHARGKRFEPDVDFAQISKRTVGFSGADIENILNEAAILAVRENRERISMANIDEAIDRRIAGPAKKSQGMNDKERKTVAYHEAGHAIIGLNVPHSDIVQKITIIPRGRTGGHVLMTPEDDRFLMTKKELEARIIGYLGGRSSEEVFFDDVSTGAQNDIEVATRIARLMVTELGMSSLGPIQYEKNSSSVFLGRDYSNPQKNFSSSVANEIDREVRKIIDEAHEEAIRIIKKHKNDVILIAETLLEKETITAEEIDYLLKHRTLPVEPQKGVTEIKGPVNGGENEEVPLPTIAGEKPVEEKKAPVKKPSSATKKTPTKKDE